MLYNSIVETIGNTPLIKLNKLTKACRLSANIYAKVEYFNPGGSVKDRIALQILQDAIDEKKVNKDTVIVEPTSGNTGIGLALMCAYLGNKCIFTMPSSMSIERVKTLRAYGAEIVLTDPQFGMKGAVEKANEIAKNTPNSFIPMQFDNPSNPKSHYLYTGKEIYTDLKGKVDIFVAGIGTGGTISGVGKFLKEKNKDVKIIGVEPSGSPLLTHGVAGKHKIEGIGANFVPSILDKSVLNEVFDITDQEAVDNARLVAKIEGIFVGISSGAALAAAIKLAQRTENKGKNIVVLFPDGGLKYLSTILVEQPQQ
jgi:cysteine synthase A